MTAGIIIINLEEVAQGKGKAKAKGNALANNNTQSIGNE